MYYFLEILKSILFGVLEGVTEWLPISSTGHLIILEQYFKMNVCPELGTEFSAEYSEMFRVVIQLGAMLAVAVIYSKKLFPFLKKGNKYGKKESLKLWSKVAVASCPAFLVGVIADKVLEALTGHDFDSLFYNPYTVSVTLILYGILFIVIEKKKALRPDRVRSVEDIKTKDAFFTGAFQALAIIPGTSRSGSTILGARMLGVGRGAAAEFSFFMGVPIMAGASFVKLIGFFGYMSKNSIVLTPLPIVTLAVAFVSAFAVSMVAIRFLIEFVKKHSFIPFGIYRIVLGVILILYFSII